MATARVSLSTTAWTSCGTAPCFLQLLSGGPVLFVVDTTTPTLLSADAAVLGGSQPSSANILISSQNVYARSAGPDGVAAVVSVTR